MSNKKLLIILSPPRGFTSVVSTMIGQHPDLYGFPELNLFFRDTIEETMILHIKSRKEGLFPYPDGLLRTLAQLHDGVQTTWTIFKAVSWLEKRLHWSTKKLYDYLLELVHPKIGVEKTPGTATKIANIERAHYYYPQAHFLHLTRHPISAKRSMEEFYEAKRQLEEKSKVDTVSQVLPLEIVDTRMWYHMHRNIINATAEMPLGQCMRIKGEDVLSETDLYLKQIAEWMGIRSDPEAIEAMKHPETSPYAKVGPFPAWAGNDGKFMRDPKLRPGRVKEPSLKSDLEHGNMRGVLGDDFIGRFTTLSRKMGYL